MEKARSRKPFVEPKKVEPTITTQHGNVYISYPPGTIGDQMPCVFCHGAECESIRKVGSKFPTLRYKCPVNSEVFINPPPGTPKNCPRLIK